ncbi:hypothetical protein HMPREF1979_00301 [Actinomyces johnsonii F0542]|uniref:Uncharacterized protein n=1 Tax=Actinomyces johnsonii F0542 TaxID=1321818 RepID=U1QVU3_9ACTO|nr:hypothetical protein HMPREF1979_00301 [Actinomyces johnsonii F0542]
MSRLSQHIGPGIGPSESSGPSPSGRRSGGHDTTAVVADSGAEINDPPVSVRHDGLMMLGDEHRRRG